MSYLLLSICTTSFIFILFKLFSTYRIDTNQAITVNYVVACCCGLLLRPKSAASYAIMEASWFFGAVALGIFFILIFNLMAVTTQKNGVSVAVVASKMSIAIPVIAGIWIYHEDTSVVKLTGIGIALLAVYLTATKPSSSSSAMQKKHLMLPILVFIGSGIIDTSLKYFESYYVTPQETAVFSATIFGAAACVGILRLGYVTLTQKNTLGWKHIVAGIVLGIPNYYSIYFLIQALRESHLDSATVFTINNVSVLVISTIVSLFLFKEKLYRKNYIGIALAIASILIITLSAQ